MTHDALVDKGIEWLYRFGCKVVIPEQKGYSETGEIADVLGWKHQDSILIEAKASREDFLSDRRKPFRQDPSLGMGNYRLYLCPTDLIQPNELPEGWGLLWCSGKNVRRIIAPLGNTFWRPETFGMKRFEANRDAEVQTLLAAMRRDLAGNVYDRKWVRM